MSPRLLRSAAAPRESPVSRRTSAARAYSSAARAQFAAIGLDRASLPIAFPSVRRSPTRSAIVACALQIARGAVRFIRLVESRADVSERRQPCPRNRRAPRTGECSRASRGVRRRSHLGRAHRCRRGGDCPPRFSPTAGRWTTIGNARPLAAERNHSTRDATPPQAVPQRRGEWQTVSRQPQARASGEGPRARCPAGYAPARGACHPAHENHLARATTAARSPARRDSAAARAGSLARRRNGEFDQIRCDPTVPVRLRFDPPVVGAALAKCDARRERGGRVARLRFPD